MPMHIFELRPVDDGFELRGGQLQKSMVFHEVETRRAVHLVGFLSQKLGSELRVFNAAGEVVETRRYEPVVATSGAAGGLQGPGQDSRNRSGQITDTINFRSDVNTDGLSTVAIPLIFARARARLCRNLILTPTNPMKKLLLSTAVALICAFAETPRVSAQSANFTYSNFSGTYTPGSSFSFDITLNFTAGGNIVDVEGISYWLYQSAGPGYGLQITNRDPNPYPPCLSCGSRFREVQSNLAYPQPLDPINRNPNGTPTSTDLGGVLSLNFPVPGLPSGSYFVARITLSIPRSALPGTYTIGNTVSGIPGVGGRISVINDSNGTTRFISASNFSFTVQRATNPNQ